MSQFAIQGITAFGLAISTTFGQSLQHRCWIMNWSKEIMLLWRIEPIEKQQNVRAQTHFQLDKNEVNGREEIIVTKNPEQNYLAARMGIGHRYRCNSLTKGAIKTRSFSYRLFHTRFFGSKVQFWLWGSQTQFHQIRLIGLLNAVAIFTQFGSLNPGGEIWCSFEV